MKSSEVLLTKIKDMEGLYLDAYLDAVKVPTIGYGHTLGVKMGDKITKEDADRLLLEDLAPKEKSVNMIVTQPMTQGEFDAFVDFAFNLGIGSFSRSTLLTLFNQGKKADASKEFVKWNMAGGKPLVGLTKRRIFERDRFLGLI